MERAPLRAGRHVVAADSLRHRFEAVVFDWDGTVVSDRSADATRARATIEELCALGMHLAVVSGTNVDNVDGQLRARPSGAGRLYLLLNRGSEVFLVDRSGPQLLDRLRATPAQEQALTEAAELTVRRLEERGLSARIVSQRLNRRKVDLIPLPEWNDPPKARMTELLAAVEERLARAGLAGLPEVARIAETAASECGLTSARVTSDAKYIEIGLTDKSDSAHWIFLELWRRGIAPGQVLLAGDEMGPLGGLPGSDSLLLVPESRPALAVSVGVEPGDVPRRVLALGGGPATMLELFDDQVRRRTHHDLPEIDEDPAWTLSIHGLDPELERTHEALLTLGDGRIGTRGSLPADTAAADPAVLASGLYVGTGPTTELLSCPLWNRLRSDLSVGAGLVRVLDLHTGVLRTNLRTNGGVLGVVSFSSLAQPGVVALRAGGPKELLAEVPALQPPERGAAPETGEADGATWMRVVGSRGGVAAAAAQSRIDTGGGPVVLDRFARYAVDPDEAPTVADALGGLQEATAAGFERLLADHREAWAGRWNDADIVIDGDVELQQALRFSLFHLMASAGETGEAAVGARGLSGPAYRGHVFWDSDVFVLPFLAATHPSAARAMLEYRIRRLPAALSIAKQLQRKGARFPWESAATGFDVTPRTARASTGGAVPIRTGFLEEHIVADVAWAAACYADWSGDEEFMAGPGRTLLVETARYWASRVRFDHVGRAHIYGVIGPDEYHEPVDDNAFTNVMARWNLRRAFDATEGDEHPDVVGEFERLHWIEVADALHDGYDPVTGLYEQFAGFFDLEPIVIEDFAPRRPVAADQFLGRERARGAQVVKQADVLMLHHLIPDAVAEGSLEPNLSFYEPRTAHGSSLSPGVYASLYARAGHLAAAETSLNLAARIDLDDLTGSTAGGLHLATMGTMWQAVAFGFAGLRPVGTALRVDPRLGPSWKRLEIRVRFRGSRVRVRANLDQAVVHADPAVPILVGQNDSSVLATPEGIPMERAAGTWRVVVP